MWWYPSAVVIEGLAAGTGLTMVVRIKEDQVVCGQPSG